ncbi:MAG TPA: LamG-like jellyroll fold domain-containing protein [Polyangia bacterium]
MLDETAGATAKDSSSHHYDITNLTGVTWSQGAVFDGVSCGGSASVDPSYRVPPVTISAWLTPQARADETANQYVLVPFPTNAVGDDLPGAFGYGIGLNVWTDGNGGSALSAEDLDTCHGPINGTVTCDIKGTQPDGGAGFAADREYFVSVTVEASLAAAIYVDGAPFQTTTAAPLATSAETTLYLGRHNDDLGYASKRFFSGRIRDVRVYKRELGADELAQLYANGPTTTAPARQ